MISTKKIIVYALIAVLLVVAAFALYQNKPNETAQIPQMGDGTEVKPATTFLIGDVLKVADNKIHFVVAVNVTDADGKPLISYQERIAVPPTQTKLSDFKQGATIVVYYYPEKALAGQIEAEKIEILK